RFDSLRLVYTAAFTELPITSSLANGKCITGTTRLVLKYRWKLPGLSGDSQHSVLFEYLLPNSMTCSSQTPCPTPSISSTTNGCMYMFWPTNPHGLMATAWLLV